MSLRDAYHTLASTPSDSLPKVYKVKALGKHLHTREGEIERVSLLCAAKVVFAKDFVHVELLQPGAGADELRGGEDTRGVLHSEEVKCVC